MRREPDLGRHLAGSIDGCVRHLLEIRQAGRDLAAAEELIADAVAAEILIPTAVAAPILGSGTVRARAVAHLFSESPASRSACATRAAEQCPGSGYVVVASGPEVFFAAPFGEQIRYRIRRGTRQPEASALAQAEERRIFQGTGRLHFRSGASTRVWNVDAVTADDGYTFAVFTSERFPGTDWTPPNANIEPAEAPEVTCLDCGENGPSWHRCPRCDAMRCILPVPSAARARNVDHASPRRRTRSAPAVTYADHCRPSHPARTSATKDSTDHGTPDLTSPSSSCKAPPRDHHQGDQHG